MITFVNTIKVHRPIAEMYAFLLDLENLPKWNYYVLEVTKLSTGPIGVGTTFHQVRVTDEQDLVITDLKPNWKIAVQTLPGSSLSLEMTLMLHEQGDATLVQDEWKLKSGLPPAMEWFGAGRIKSAAAENLVKLKELLEEGQVVLQDGRLAGRQG